MVDRFFIQDLFGERIERLWSESQYDFTEGSIYREIKDRGFAIQREVLLNSLMFVGINPSYNVGSEPAHLFYDVVFNKIHPYYRKFFDIADKVELPWSHVDLLFIRETNQKNVKYSFEREYKCPHFIDFLKKQYAISREIIEMAMPKMIVVNNTIARDWLTRDYKQTFDEELGTYIIDEGKLKGTPVFYCSMLTGQRALDNGSYERLIWHIKYVLRRM